jgi:CheY-like chemotaxis protein/glycine cleavage system H lipoate-binding protein
MVIAFMFVSVILFVLADLAVRSAARGLRERRKRREREEALASSLQLDFSREAKTLKRAEVLEPAARILCVDDEEVILCIFRRILVLNGYCVDTVETGQEALGLIRTRHYDFLFTDLKMPAMDGMEVVKAVKHLRPDIDVIVITGYATVETAVECMKNGAMDYVQKPFTAGELLAFVKKALIKRRDRIEKELKPAVHISGAAPEGRSRGGEFFIPGGALISQGHCWASLGEDGSVKVGLDDFARKLIGRVDAVEFPNVGMRVKAGQPLFSVRQDLRRAQFHAPVGGKVVKLNEPLARESEALELTPYQKNWVCVIDADNLDADLPALRIGKSAVALFQDDIERLRSRLRGAGAEEGADAALLVGALERLDDERWEALAKEFFGR